MKHLFIFCLILSLTSNGFAFGGFVNDLDIDDDGIWGRFSEDLPDPNCGNTPKELAFLKVYESKCNLGLAPNKKTCNCLNAEGVENFLIGEFRNSTSKEILKKQKAKIHQEYINRFKYAYSKMTVEAALQEQVFGIESSKVSPYVGCSPKDTAEKIKVKIKAANDNKLNTIDSKIIKLGETRKHCDEGFLRGKKGKERCEKNIDSQIKNLTNKKLEIQNKKEEQIDSDCGVALHTLDIANILSSLENAKKYYQKNNNDKKVKETDKLINQIKNPVEKSGPATNSCSANSMPATALAQTLISEYKNDKYPGADGIKPRTGQCKGEEGPGSLCEALENTNAELANKVEDRMRHDVPTQCFSFAEFQAFQGAPGEKMMKFLEKGKRIDEILSTPTSQSGDLNEERLKFLQSNPSIAKLAQNPDSKKVLTQGLQQMAKDWSKLKTKAQKLRSYLNFMKGVVGAELKKPEAKKTEEYICDQLAGNFSAIMVAEHLPKPDKAHSGEDPIRDLEVAVEQCTISSNNNTKVGDSEARLKTDPIYTLAPENTDKAEDEIENNYNKFLDEHCKGYEDKMKSPECQGDAKIEENCRQKYLDETHKVENQILKDAGFISKPDVKKAMERTDQRYQDKEFKDWWQEEIGSKMSQSPIPMSGQEKAFFSQQETNREMMSNTAVPDRFADSENFSGGSSASSSNGGSFNGAVGGSVGSSVSPGSDSNSDNKLTEKQVIPDFKQNPLPSFDKEKLRSGAPIEQAIPSLAGKSPTEKVEILENFKQNLPERDKDLIPKIEDAQELAASDIPDPLEDEKDKKKNEDKNLDKKVFAKNPGQSVGGNLGNNPSTSVGAGLGQVGGANFPRVDISRTPKKDKTLEQLNQTLVDVYDKKDGPGSGNGGAPSRGPASVNEIQVSENTPAIIVDSFAKADDLPKTPEGVLIVRDQDLVIKNGYDEIINDKQKLSAFVKSSLKGEQVGSEVVRVTDAKTGLHSLLLVNPGKHGLIIKRVDRIATYTGLIYANSAAAPQTP